MPWKSITVVTLTLLGISVNNGQLLNQPGPPYPDEIQNSQQSQQWPPPTSPKLTKTKFGMKQRFPIINNNVMQSLYNALGSRLSFQVTPPRLSYHNDAPRQNNAPRQNHGPQQQSHSQSPHPVQAVHVYIPQFQKESMQRPMPNVIVRHVNSEGSQSQNYRNQYGSYSHAQPVPEFSQPQPVFHQPVGFPFNAQPLAQHLQSMQPIIQSVQPIVVQYPRANQYNSQNAYSQPQYPVIQGSQSLQDHQQQEQLQSDSFLSVQVSNGKRGPRRHKRPHKGKKLKGKKKSKGKPFPVFATLGKGLDAVNAVRRGVKKGAGTIVAGGVKLSGKLAYAGAGVAAKVIKAASSI